MPLTPQDVHSKVFGPTRFRRGYDEAEVDAFLDEVEAELTRLHREIDSLRAQLAGGGPADGTGADGADTSSMPAFPADEAQSGAPSRSATAVSAQAAAQSVGHVQDGGNLEQQVARALVLAQRAADEAVRDAEQQAEQLRLAAQTEAERIRAEAAERAEQERREIEQTRAQAEDDVEQLRAFEREYRTRLRAYLEHQLHELEHQSHQVEGRQPEALAGGASEPDTVGTRNGVGAGAPPGQLPSDLSTTDLPTTDLPADDPAAVPQLSPPSEGSVVPPSVAVSDYSAPSGVGDQTVGDELSHERRELHDGL